MALDNNATFIAGTGDYFIAPYVEGGPAALPSDLTVTPASPWENIGHTSLDDVLSFASEGGEQTTIGTLQNKALRTTTSTRIETINFNLQQFDEDSLKLYYGSNATIGSEGEVQIPISPEPTTCSFLAIFKDGNKRFAIYAPKAEVFRSDDVAVADTESLASLPLSVKPLVHGSNGWAFAVTPLA